jgi:hypothetical protein
MPWGLMARCVHWRIACRADAPAGYQNLPPVVFVTVPMMGRDVHNICAVVVMRAWGRGHILRICRAHRRRSHKGGYKEP